MAPGSDHIVASHGIPIMRWILTLVVGLLTLPLLTGCNLGHPQNPSFPLSESDARRALEQMAASPKPPVRPVVIAGGWGGANLAELPVVKSLREALGHRNVVVVTFHGTKDFQEARRRLISGVQRVLPGETSLTTAEVDVVGISLGGLIAVDAAAVPTNPRQDPRRLDIHTLYAISTPFDGAQMAIMPGSRFLDEMNPRSPYIQRIREEAGKAPYPIIAYGRLGDFWVGEKNISPPGTQVYWLPNQMFADAHHGFNDPRIAADIARRLRGEKPFTTSPPAPLP